MTTTPKIILDPRLQNHYEKASEIIQTYLPEILEERFIEEFKVIINILSIEDLKCNDIGWKNFTQPQYLSIIINFSEIPKFPKLKNTLEIALRNTTTAFQ